MRTDPRAFLVEPICDICGCPATRAELRREGMDWRFLYSGLVAGNGNGSIVSEDHAALLTAAFTDPPQFDLMFQADLQPDYAGFCKDCATPYCFTHWNTSPSGYGTCPRGHGRSLDPHWSPDY